MLTTHKERHDAESERRQPEENRAHRLSRYNGLATELLNNIEAVALYSRV
jgi:hypothetical protein